MNLASRWMAAMPLLMHSLTTTHLGVLDGILWDMLTAPVLPAWPSDTHQRRELVRCVLCWALLLRATAEPPYRGFWTSTREEQCEALVHFLESVMALGPEAMEHGCALLCWRVFTLTEDDTSRRSWR